MLFRVCCMYMSSDEVLQSNPDTPSGIAKIVLNVGSISQLITHKLHLLSFYLLLCIDIITSTGCKTIFTTISILKQIRFTVMNTKLTRMPSIEAGIRRNAIC